MSDHIIKRDYAQRKRVSIHESPYGDELVVAQEQNVGAILEDARLRRQQIPGHRPRYGEGKLVGWIPGVIYGQMLRDGRAKDPQAIADWADDPDNSAFRFFPGKIGKVSNR